MTPATDKQAPRCEVVAVDRGFAVFDRKAESFDNEMGTVRSRTVAERRAAELNAWHGKRPGERLEQAATIAAAEEPESTAPFYGRNAHLNALRYVRDNATFADYANLNDGLLDGLREGASAWNWHAWAHFLSHVRTFIREREELDAQIKEAAKS